MFSCHPLVINKEKNTRSRSLHLNSEALTHLAIFRHGTLAESVITAAAAAAAAASVQTVMAALRRVAALLGLRTAAAAVQMSGSVSRQGASVGRLQRRCAAWVCVATGGAAAAAGLCWFGSRETRNHSSSISGLLASISTVVKAKEKVGEDFNSFNPVISRKGVCRE